MTQLSSNNFEGDSAGNLATVKVNDTHCCQFDKVWLITPFVANHFLLHLPQNAIQEDLLHGFPWGQCSGDYSN